MADVQDEEALIQIAERQLAEAEAAFRRDPSDENERRIWRAWTFARDMRERTKSVKSHSTEPTAVEPYTFDDDGRIPNSPLPVIIYHDLSEAHDATGCEELFARHGWLGAWRNGIYDFHHFHSTTHEVLGIARGRVSVILGGPSGRRFELSTGDVVVLPAGTGHRNAGSTPDLLVVGAYPDGMTWDIRRGDPSERDAVLGNISAVPLPRQDPVKGADGPLVELWSGSG